MVFNWSIYYLSFAPLWVSVIFINAMSLVHGTDSPKSEILSLFFIPVLFIASLIIMLKKLRPIKIGTLKYGINAAREEKLLTAEFLATFIIPLFAFDFTKWEGIALFAFFFVVFGWLCDRHNYFCTNIMLEVCGYKIYDCTLLEKNSDMEIEKKVISKRNLNLCIGDYVHVKNLNNDYSFDCFTKSDLLGEE